MQDAILKIRKLDISKTVKTKGTCYLAVKNE